MHELTLAAILYMLTFLYVYERQFLQWIWHKWNIGKGLNIQPFNCIFCLSFWFGVAACVTFFVMGFDLANSTFLMSTPLLYRIVQIKLLK